MLKKIVILALLLNIPYARPADSSAVISGADLCGGILIAAGAIASTWLAYKDLKKGCSAPWKTSEQIDILNKMGCKVYTKSTMSVRWDGALVLKERYTIDIPASFSREQRQKANEHWGLLLASENDFQNMLGYPAMASLFCNLALLGFWLNMTRA